jgi:hypothetical protein
MHVKETGSDPWLWISHSGKRSYNGIVSVKNGYVENCLGKQRKEGVRQKRIPSVNACEESLSQATAGRGDTMARYPLKTDTQNVAWRSCKKEVSVRKGYLGYVFCRRPRTYVQKACIRQKRIH